MRHGSGKVVMSLSKDDSTKIWEAVENRMFIFRRCGSKADGFSDNLALFNSINQKLVHPAGVNLRHIPIKIYLPAASVEDSTGNPTPGHLRVVQSLVTPSLSSREFVFKDGL
jgi:autophagy-related protein 5